MCKNYTEFKSYIISEETSQAISMLLTDIWKVMPNRANIKIRRQLSAYKWSEKTAAN